MKILLIHQAFALASEAGGTRHFEFARYLKQAGHQVTVITDSKTYQSGKRATIKIECVDGIEIRRINSIVPMHTNYFYRFLAFVFFSVGASKEALNVSEVDLVMGTSPSLVQPLCAWLVARLKKRPFVLEIRDIWPEFAIEMNVLRNPLLIKMAYWLERFLYHTADHIIINSPGFETILRKKGVPPAKLTLIPNGVDLKMFTLPAPQGALRMQLPGNKHWLAVYAGAMGPANDLESLIEAARLLTAYPEIQLVLVGNGKSRPALEKMTADYNLSNVIFVDSVAKNDMSHVLADADVCVATLKNIPMFTTTYPNKVFDYMAAAKPVICAIDGVIRDVVEQSHCGAFVSPGNSKKLADAILYMYQNPELARRMGEQGREYVKTHFCRETHARALLSLFETIHHRVNPTLTLGLN